MDEKILRNVIKEIDNIVLDYEDNAVERVCYMEQIKGVLAISKSLLKNPIDEDEK